MDSATNASSVSIIVMSIGHGAAPAGNGEPRPEMVSRILLVGFRPDHMSQTSTKNNICGPQIMLLLSLILLDGVLWCVSCYTITNVSKQSNAAGNLNL